MMDVFLGKPISFWITVLNILNTLNVSDEEIMSGRVKIVRLTPQELSLKETYGTRRHNQP